MTDLTAAIAAEDATLFPIDTPPADPYESTFIAWIHLASGATVTIRDTDRTGGVEIAVTDGDTGETVIADMTGGETFRVTSAIHNARA